jgi:hypothetical protein
VQEQEQLIPLRDIWSERDEVRWKPAADGRIRSDRGDGAGSHGLGVALRAVDEESGEDGRDQRGTDETRRHGRKTVGMRLDRADTAVFGAAGARSAPARAPSITFADHLGVAEHHRSRRSVGKGTQARCQEARMLRSAPLEASPFVHSHDILLAAAALR